LRITFLAALAAPLTLAFAACGDEAERSVVDVTLSEWSVDPETTSVKEGEVTFSADNDGEQEHELVIVRTDAAADDLPTNDDGSVDEDAAGVDVIGETDEIDSGDSDSRVFTLDPGKYVLLCNLVHEQHEEKEVHYQLGMHAEFEVTAAE
jgi:uncharacterized cupredoxin-like copper-binding protein